MEHFSRYGLIDLDDEEDDHAPAPDQAQQAAPAPPPAAGRAPLRTGPAPPAAARGFGLAAGGDLAFDEGEEHGAGGGGGGAVELPPQ